MNTNLENLKKISMELYDIQQMRIAVVNRVNASRRRGFRVDAIEPLQRALDEIDNAEKIITKMLLEAFKVEAPTEIVQFAANTAGIGKQPKLLARLMGEIGDLDTWQEAKWEKGKKDEDKRVLVLGDTWESSVRDLWAYCGVGDPERKIKAGMSQEELLACGNPRAKFLVRLIAEQMVKNKRSAYRKVYDIGRQKYENRTHAEPCPQCGTPGHPAMVGSPWRDGHKHAAALRLTGKAVLKDLWRVRHGQTPVYGGKTQWTQRKIA